LPPTTWWCSLRATATGVVGAGGANEAAGRDEGCPPGAASSASIREAALAVLALPSYRQSAERICDEMASLPSPDAMVTLLEGLAAFQCCSL
jgi:UDP:flavonoid glycosyltransferase YjiC (YdhE family)